MLVRALKLQLTGGETLVGALNALVTQKWSASVVNGQTILGRVIAGAENRSGVAWFPNAHFAFALSVEIQWRDAVGA